jgi:signal peptide peptidase SppA
MAQNDKNYKNNKRSLPILLEYATNQQWAVHHPVLERMVSIAEKHCNDAVRIDEESLLEITSVRDQRSEQTAAAVAALDVSGDTAIIHIDGVIAKYSRMVNGSSQPRGTSLETLNAQLDAALDDYRVKSIFLRIESPGGSCAGLADFADRIYEASMQKPVIAFADDLAASAAYWIGSQASRFYSCQSAFVGSIGVYSLMVDSSAAAEAEGYKVHIVRSGSNKGVGAAGVAITDENLSYVQGLIDESYEEFLIAVMRGRADRGLTDEKLRAIADGRVVKAAEAKSVGLIDGIMTLGQAFNSARPNPRKETGNHAAASAETTEINENTKQNTEQTIMDEPTTTLKTDTADKSLEPLSIVGKMAQIDPGAIAAATSAERKRITDINSALGGNPALAATMAAAIESGASVEDAKAAGFDVLQSAGDEALAEKDAELAEANKRLETIAGAGEGDIAAPGSDDAAGESATAGDDATPAAYEAAVDANIAAGKTVARSYRDATVSHPKSHAAWTAASTELRNANAS